MFPPCKGKYTSCIHRKKIFLPPIISALVFVIIFEVKHEAGRFLLVLKMYLGRYSKPLSFVFNSLDVNGKTH